MNPKNILNQMTLREKIAQMYLQYFQGYEDMPEAMKLMNQKTELGGFIFFSGNNVKTIDQLHEMTTRIQNQARNNRFNLPFLLTIDQEGGQLAAIFRGNTLFPGNMSLGLTNDQTLAYEQGRHVAKELKYAGIDVCFAPVLDVDYDVVNGVPIVDNRRYSHLPEVVADMGKAYIKGIQDEGIIACGKHFPGMRITEVDTHFAMDRSPYPMERLEQVEIHPFREAINEGLQAIMTHHGIFDAIDPELPASLSEKAIGYLRNTLGFEGLVVTDDLVMQAILHEYGPKEPIKLAINAGSDIIISTTASDWYVDYVEACVLEGTIDVARIDEACGRILTYKAQMNMGLVAKEKTYSDQEGKALARKIAKKALVLTKGNAADFPLKSRQRDQLGIVFGNPARLVMSDATNLYDISLKKVIEEQGHFDTIKEAIMPWNPTKEEIISLADIGIISDLIIFTTVNAYRFDQQLEVLKEIRKYCPNKTIIAIATRSPLDAPLLEVLADYVVVTGGLTENTFEALGDCLFGEGSFEPHEPLDYLKSKIE
jgi:beta-N-acetylhexosaminidase